MVDEIRSDVVSNGSDKYPRRPRLSDDEWFRLKLQKRKACHANAVHTMRYSLDNRALTQREREVYNECLDKMQGLLEFVDKQIWEKFGVSYHCAEEYNETPYENDNFDEGDDDRR